MQVLLVMLMGPGQGTELPYQASTPLLPPHFLQELLFFIFFSSFSGRFCALSSKVTRETHSTYHSVNIEMLFISIREALR